MDVVTGAPNLIAALFEDGGETLLREAGIGPDWPSALAHVPPELLDVGGPNPGLTLVMVLRDFWSKRNDLRPAIAATRALLRFHVGRGGHDSPDTLVELGALGALAQRAGKVEEGAQLLEKSYQDLKIAVGSRDLRLAVVASNLALHHVRRGDHGTAEALLANAYRIRTLLAPQTTAQAAAQLGEVRAKLGRELEASPLYREAWEKTKAQFGEEHPKTVARARAYGTLLNAIGHHGLALMPLRVVYDQARRQGDAETIAACGFDLGVALDAVGQKEEGLRLVEDALRWTRSVGTDIQPHGALAHRLTTYASMQLQRGRAAEAEGLMKEALEAERLLFGDASAEVATRYASLGYFFARSGRSAEALGWLDPAASLLRTAVGDQDPRTRVLVDDLVGLLIAQAEAAVGKRDKRLAAEMLRRAWSVGVPVLGHADRKVLKVRELSDGLGLRL